MDNSEEYITENNVDEATYNDDKPCLNTEVNEKEISDLITSDDANESSLLNSIVEAVMRGDMNQVVSLALSHRNIDPKDKVIVDEAISTALRNKLKCDQNKEIETDIDSESRTTIFDKEDDVTSVVISELSESKKDSSVDLPTSSTVYSTMKSDENNDIQCSYYIDSSSIMGSSNNITYCQPGFHNSNIELENNSEDLINGSYSQYQTSTTSLQNLESMNSLNSSQQSVQVQLPGIGNFLLQIPSNLKPGEPITLPISLPLTPVSQTSGGTPISINMNTGQLISNQLLSLYNPSSCLTNITLGRKMRAIAPKPSKPTYRQPLIAPKTSSPNSSTYNLDCLNNISSTPLPAPSGPGRRKGTKGKKASKKKGTQPKSRKDSSYASSTHSIDSQDGTQYNEPNNTLKQNCNNFIGSRNTYQCNYFVNGDSSDYINQSHIVSQSYGELHTNNLIDTSDSGEKDLLSLAWEISNAELGNNDDFTATYQLYDTNNLTTESFVSSEILDQFLENIQKDEISELSRCSSNQINLDSRVSYASSFTTLPPCSTVLPSVTTSSYLNNSANNPSNLELSNCIEIAEVVNLNTEDMLSELENEENALLDKFVAQYSSNASDSLKCDTHLYNALNASSRIESVKYGEDGTKNNFVESKIDESDKDIDPNVKDSNELSEIAKQIEKDCDESNTCKNYLSQQDYNYINPVEKFDDRTINIDDENFSKNVTTSLELMYPASSESFNSNIVDCQSQYLMSVNVDGKTQCESAYYITDGSSLPSKTLDDFGLFDFCSERGIVNHDSDINGSLEEKKYIEPPILEDISDASPIPSDEESEDDDIDTSAFRLSTYNHLPLFSDRSYPKKGRDIEALSYSSAVKDLPTLFDASKIERQNCSSDKWYIYDTLVDISDAFYNLKENVTQEHKSDIDCDVLFNRVVQSEDDSKQSDVVQEPNFSERPQKHKDIIRAKCKQNVQAYDSCYYKDRQSRLRKPPTKLAIYHSIKFIEKEIKTENSEERSSVKNVDKVKCSKDINSDLKSTHNMKANHCTRSKGSISKSYDSFYETLEKTNRQTHSKLKKTKNHVYRKKAFAHKSDDNCQTSEVINSITDIQSQDVVLNVEEDVMQIDSMNANVNVRTNVEKLDESTLKNDQVDLINMKKDKLKKPSKVSRKYNLRQKCLSSENNVKEMYDKKISSKLKEVRKYKNLKIKPKEQEKEDNLCENDKINTSELCDIEDPSDTLVICDLVVEHKLQFSELQVHELHNAAIEESPLLLNCLIEIQKHEIDDPSKEACKRLCPVRKINRKLRLLSGLEHNENINWATVIDLSPFEDLIEYSLDIKVIQSSTFNYSFLSGLDCTYFSLEELNAEYELQHFDVIDEDFDDGDSCDARLVIVENDEILNPASTNTCNILQAERPEDIIIGPSDLKEINKEIELKVVSELPKRYSLRNKQKDTLHVVNDIIESDTTVISPCSKRPSLKRSCKKAEGYNQEELIDEIVEENLINKLSLKTPICSIPMLTTDDLLANLSTEDLESRTDNSASEKNTFDIINNLPTVVRSEYKNEVKSVSIQLKDQIITKIHKRILENKAMMRTYKNHIKFIWRAKDNKKMSYSKRLREKFRSKWLNKENKIIEDLTLIEKGIEKINFDTDEFTRNSMDNDNDSIEVTDDIPEDRLCTFVDSNNIETFSRSYGSFSLKIKFQKQDNIETPENKEPTKKHKKSSKKRKRLRHFLSRIIRSNDSKGYKSNSEDKSCNEESDINTKHITRKRKHSDASLGSVDSSNQENINQCEDTPPKLTPEPVANEDCQHQKPIKIKLFKSTSEDLSKSEEMIFSLQKSNSEHKKESKSSVPKMLQVLKDQPSKPCRQAANVAKKKIFSTAKEFRRSQNATLTSIWNPRKLNNALNKLPADFINSYNDRGRRRRGRPPKSNHVSLLSDKQTSSTGTLKLKIRLSKDFKNCNEDNLSSNGEISGRTSTNDSSILNSAVAGINGPSDALSLESNNFINGITQQLDENIEYLEAKEAKVYFDPHQVDIEKIKNSYYSSKKNSSLQFDCESQQNLYDESIPDLSNKKKEVLSNSQDFSQYNDNESSTSYNNTLLKDYPSNNTISHLPKDLTNNSENCYNALSSNREPQDLSQSNQSYSFENQMSSPGKNQSELWPSSKSNSSDLAPTCRNPNNPWFSDNRSFPNSNSILYDSYITSNIKDAKSCTSQSQNPPFMCENETPDSKHIQRSPSKRSSSKEGRKSSNNSFESHGQLSPNYTRGSVGPVPPQLNIHPWTDETNHSTSLNNTAAAWMTYAQQQAAAAAYMDPQMKAYYNLALSQSMLNNPYCGSYNNPVGNPENFYSSLHSQYLNNSKELNEKNSNASGTIRNHNDPMGTFMEAAQMSSWEHFYSAAAMAGYHNSSQGNMDDYTGRAGNMLQAHHMLTGGYPGSVLSRDHFPLEGNKPPVAHQSQSGSTSPMKPIASPTPISSAQAYSHVQMPYSHFNGFF